MKNSKLLKASVAGAAVVAIAAGGGTYSAWSDFATQSAGAGAGFLRLNLGDHQGTDTNVVQPFSLAPGQHKTQDFYLASADSGNTPDGAVTAYVDKLTSTEDTASGTCTTASEAAAEDTSNCAANGGELAQQAHISVWKLDNVSSQAECDHYDSSIPALVNNVVMDAAPTSADPITVSPDLAPGKGVCMVVEVSLPYDSATNASQGDQMSWDWHFDLTQL
jgi:hypothetical protein